MDYLQVVEELIREWDLSTEAGRKKAYEKCEDYADEHFRKRRDFNAFMEVVADKLDMPPTRRNSFAEEIGAVPEAAKLHLRYSEGGPEFTGNAEGLRYLAALCTELAREAVEGDHVHLYTDSPPMCGKTFPLTVYHEPDAWFEELDAKEAAEAEEEPAIQPRDLQASEVAALCVLAEMPPNMLLTKERLYRVLSTEPCQNQDVWTRRIRDDNGRLFLFTVTNDDGAEQRFGFDLDDPQVLFFSRQNLVDVRGGS